MADSATPNDGRGQDPRAQLSKLNALFVLATLMFERTDDAEILHLAMSSVASLGSCRVEAGYVAHGSELVRVPFGETHTDLVAQVMGLEGASGAVMIDARQWARALPLASLDHGHGYLVVSAAAQPGDDEQFLLRVLTQQTGVALGNAHLHGRDRAQAREIRTLNTRLASLNTQLATTVSDLETRSKIYAAFTRLPMTDESEQEVADTLHALTGLPAVVEDVFGNPRAWAGPGRPEPYPKQRRRGRQALLRRAGGVGTGAPVRDRDRLVALAHHQGDVLGVLALIDAEESAGQHELFALERGVVVLALSLAYKRAIDEMELRLRGDLVDDLVAGQVDAAFARAGALDHDLHDPHWTVVVRSGVASTDAVLRAVERAAADLEMPMLLGRLSGAVAMVVKQPEIALADPWRRFHSVLVDRLGSAVAVGVGGQSNAPDGLARSFEEATLAVGIREHSGTPNGVTAFEELGIYRLIAPSDRTDEAERFIQQWIGPLLEYDAAHDTELVRTLSAYLESGGSHNVAAEELFVHRSTVRYRLQRIRDLTNADLTDPDTRFNLQVATRAWRVAHGMA